MTLAVQALADSIEDVIWSLPAGDLAASAPAFAALLRSAGVRLEDLLVELADETLALCVQKQFFRRHAFEEWLVNRYEKALLGWLLRRTGDSDRARDLVQDFYVKLLEGPALASYDANYPFRPWFWQVVRRFYCDGLRRHHPALPVGDVSSGGPGPFEEATAGELRERVDEALLRLPPLQQRILQESIQGRDAGSLARELDIPKSHVYRHLFRARRTLESELGLQVG
jgi:RNA polymerase sigma factor (sigma-70 family)